MKYINTFDDFLFKEVDQNTFYKEKDKRVKEDFTKKEFNEISSLFNSDESRVRISSFKKEKEGFIIGLYKFNMSSNHQLRFEIFKVEDGWFYFNQNYRNYYICDTIDGLCQLIKYRFYKT